MLYVDSYQHGARKTAGFGAQHAAASNRWASVAVPASLPGTAIMCSAKNLEVPSTV